MDNDEKIEVRVELVFKFSNDDLGLKMSKAVVQELFYRYVGPYDVTGGVALNIPLKEVDLESSPDRVVSLTKKWEAGKDVSEL